MIIAKNKRLSDLQEEFKSQFPFLKILFFKEAHAKGVASDESLLLPDMKIGSFLPLLQEGEISLDAYQKVGDFEQEMANRFGLYVQVYRKSYKRWLQSWVTDVWTLHEHNRRGMILGDQ